MQSPSLDQSFINIEEHLKDIIDALQEIENWKKQIADNFEVKIRSLNQFSQSTHYLFETENFMKIVEEEVSEAKQKMGDFVPKFAFDWHLKKAKRSRDTSESPDETDARKIREYYSNMNDQLRECFFCMSIFPENAIIKPRDMIYWWIGGGLVNETQSKTCEQVGKEQMSELLSNNLIRPLNHRRTFMRVDPAVRDQAIYDANGCKFFAFSEGRPTSWSFGGAPHACLNVIQQYQIVSVSPPTDSCELISLLNTSGQNVMFFKDAHYKLENLTVLQLGRLSNTNNDQYQPVQIVNVDGFFQFLISVKNLRLLGLQGVFGVSKLPENLGHELSNLVILNLRACNGLESLPSSVGELRNLTHLDVSQCYKLEYFPSSIQHLEQLQVLKGFVFGYPKHDDQADMSCLVRMKKLRKLSVDFSEKSVISSSQLEAGKMMESLRSLTITWRSKKGASIDTFGDSPTLDWIPSSLEKLDLCCFPLENAPQNLCQENLPHLLRLYLRGGNLRDLGGFAPQHGHQWSIEVVRFKHLHGLEIHPCMLHKYFSRIISAEIMECHKIEGTDSGWYQYRRGVSTEAWKRLDVQIESKVERQKYGPLILTTYDAKVREEYVLNLVCVALQQKMAEAMVLACKCVILFFRGGGALFFILSLLLCPTILFFQLTYYHPLLVLALLVLFLLLLKFKTYFMAKALILLAVTVSEFAKRTVVAIGQMKPSAFLLGIVFLHFCELVLARSFTRLGVSLFMVVLFLVWPGWVKLKMGSFFLGLGLFALSYLSLVIGKVPLNYFYCSPW